MTDTENKVNTPTWARSADEDTIDLMELFSVLLRRWKLILCVMILCASAAGLYNSFCIVPMYQASSRIYISNTNTVINIQELQLSAELAADYEQILLSRTVLKKVISKMGLDMTYKDLEKVIAISTPRDSHCLDIAVSCPEPELAVEVTNCLVRTGVDQMYRIIGHEEPTVIDPAEMDAITVVKPSLAKYIALGAMFGAMVVCGILIARTLMDNTLKTEEDVEKRLGLPVLAFIPVSSAEEAKKEQRGGQYSGRKAVPETPMDDFWMTESINMLRGNIQMAGYRVQAIAITSSDEHEGKSAISFRLAQSLASLEKTVVFLDCDIRNSRFKEKFGITKTAFGLSQYLCGYTSVKEITYHTEHPNLDMIFAGSAAPNPSEILSGERFSLLMKALREQYDYIIVDTPPSNVVVDAQLVARHCDYTILLVEYGVTPYTDALRIKEKWDGFALKIMGVIMNKVPAEGTKYGKYGKYGQYGYGYGKKKTRKQETRKKEIQKKA